jgi:hypothetical protein
MPPLKSKRGPTCLPTEQSLTTTLNPLEPHNYTKPLRAEPHNYTKPLRALNRSGKGLIHSLTSAPHACSPVPAKTSVHMVSPVECTQ